MNIKFPDGDNYWILLKLVASLVFWLLFCLIRGVRKKDLNTNDLTSVSVSVTGIVLALSLFLRSITNSHILELLKEDVIALCLGALAQALSSIDSELKQDFSFIIGGIKNFKNLKNNSKNPPP